MKCHNCSKDLDFIPASEADIFCSGICRRKAQINGWRIGEYRAPKVNPEITASMKKWDEVYQRYINGTATRHEMILAMQWCLKVDRYEEERKTFAYMKKREGFFEE
jgi:endogenous inhibitor of DNA gyrase (YacG/DUF329 family)